MEEKFRLLKTNLFFPPSIFYLLSSAYCLLPSASCLLLTAYCSLLIVSAQKLAFLTPDKSPESQKVRVSIEQNLANKFQILDDSLAEAAFQNAPDQNVFNLSADEAQNFGRAAGSSFFVLVKAETLRRATLSKAGFYFESYAVIFLVSSRTGHLVFWTLKSLQGATPAEAEEKLSSAIGNLAAEISANLKSADKKKKENHELPNPEELPAEKSEAAKNFRVPLPFRRLKPEYTTLANLYNITATVDAAVDLDETGSVTRVEITRWAGYGLDESVEASIRKMQWRAAERNGKSLPVRVLLRYNFKKIDHDDE
ncbi:MAG: energy transducer TonB [Pyrinomonadaceae bacterium]